MKSLLLAAGILAAPSLAGAARIDGVYIDLGLGADFPGSQKAQRVVTPNAPIGIQATRTRFDTGARISATAGYGFANGLRVELEATVFGNGRKKTRGGVVSDAVALTNGQASGYDANVGLFVNALDEFDLSNLGLPIDVQPYVGAGVGYLRTYQQDLPRLQPGTAFTKLRGDRNSLGAQAIVGAAFPIDAVPGLAITAEYRATERTGGRYDAKLTGPGPSRPVRVNDDANLIQSAMLGIRYAFDQAPPAPPPAPGRPCPPPRPRRGPTWCSSTEIGPT